VGLLGFTRPAPIHGDRAGAEPGRKIFVETFRSLVEHQRRSFSLIELFKLEGLWACFLDMGILEF
jgi:hypothetical protein